GGTAGTDGGPQESAGAGGRIEDVHGARGVRAVHAGRGARADAGEPDHQVGQVVGRGERAAGSRRREALPQLVEGTLGAELGGQRVDVGQQRFELRVDRAILAWTSLPGEQQFANGDQAGTRRTADGGEVSPDPVCGGELGELAMYAQPLFDL